MKGRVNKQLIISILIATAIFLSMLTPVFADGSIAGGA